MIHALPAELSGAFAAGMADLQAKLGGRLGVNELDDTAPCVTLNFVPQSRTPGSNPARGRHAGHFSEYQAGAADRPSAVMHEMPVIGYAVGGLVLRHRRNDHSVREMHTRERE